MSDLHRVLQKQLDQIPSLKMEITTDPKFINWKKTTTRIIEKIFGENSPELQDFSDIQYWYVYAGERIEGMTKSLYEQKNMQNGLEQAELLLQDLVEEAKSTLKLDESKPVKENDGTKKIFISHSSKDDQIGKEVINLLQLIGINHEKIFYTSSAGYGIPLGENWIQTLKQEIGHEGVVLSLLTENYLQSQICLCEMGAAWVLSKKHIPIRVPPLTFKELNEIISTTQGFEITNSVSWSSLKKTLEKEFDLIPLPEDKWEPQRDAILVRIKIHITT